MRNACRAGRKRAPRRLPPVAQLPLGQWELRMWRQRALQLLPGQRLLRGSAPQGAGYCNQQSPTDTEATTGRFRRSALSEKAGPVMPAD